MSATDPCTWKRVSAASKNTTRIDMVMDAAFRFHRHIFLGQHDLDPLSTDFLTMNTPPASFVKSLENPEISMPSSIFIVDSSPAVRRMVEQISTPEGFEVVGFQDGPAALEAARRISPALIIADYH